MYIKKVELHNYRGYKHEVISLSQGLNSFIGKGDSGKSAALKGITWCLYNEKQGNFINKKVKTPKGKIKSNEEVYVQVTFDTGDIIRRGADSSTPNLYWIGVEGIPLGDPIKTFKDIPDEVKKVVNLASINIGAQFESHFLLSSKGGDIAKELNKLVNLEIIDTSRSNAKHFVTKIKREKESIEFDLKKYEHNLQSYAYLEDMDRFLSEVEELENIIKTLEDNKNEISFLLDTIESIEQKKDKAGRILKFKENIKATQALEAEIGLLTIEAQKIDSSLSILIESTQNRSKYEATTSYKERVKGIIEIEKVIGALEEEKDDLEKLLEIAGYRSNSTHLNSMVNYKTLVDSILHLKNEIVVLGKEYDEIKDLLDILENNRKTLDKKREYVVELKKGLKGVCPTCGRSFKGGNCDVV